MKPVTAVVTGVGAAVGLSIIKALREASLPVRVVGVDAEPLAQGFFFVDRPRLAPSCRLDPEAYCEALVQICQEEKAAILFSGWEGELPLLAARKGEFERLTGTLLPLAPGPTLMALDKWMIAQALASAGVGVADSAVPGELEGFDRFRLRNDYPYVVKPRRGWGGQGLQLVHNERELIRAIEQITDPVIQEYLTPADQEYSVGLFQDEGAVPSGVLPTRRTLANGLSYRMASDGHPVVADEAARAATALGLIGPVNVQLVLTLLGPKIFEINPRCTGGTCVRAHFGLNEPERAIRRFVLGEELPPVKIRKGYCLRYWDELYLDQEVGAEACQGRYPPMQPIPELMREE